MQTEILVEKIRGLPLSQQEEIEDFVDFLAQKEDRKLIFAGMKTSEKSFEKVWDNEEDSVYDEL